MIFLFLFIFNMNLLKSILIIIIVIYTNTILCFKSLFIYKNNAIKLYCKYNNNDIINYIDYQISLINDNDTLYNNYNSNYTNSYYTK